MTAQACHASQTPGRGPAQCVQSRSLLWKGPTLRGKDKSLGGGWLFLGWGAVAGRSLGRRPISSQVSPWVQEEREEGRAGPHAGVWSWGGGSRSGCCVTRRARSPERLADNAGWSTGPGLHKQEACGVKSAEDGEAGKGRFPALNGKPEGEGTSEALLNASASKYGHMHPFDTQTAVYAAHYCAPRVFHLTIM